MGTIEKLDAVPFGQHGDEFYNPRHKKCDQSWGFKMLDAVTRLDPRFEMPYVAGTMALSIMVEDYEGASILFDRGIAQYPHNWTLLYRAAYHFLFDKQNFEKAGSLLMRASEEGGPTWLRSLAARVYSRAGQLALGISALKSYRAVYEGNPKFLKDIDDRIEKLQREASKLQK